MPLIFINGISGSGKSTIQKELSRLGYTAYDADDPKFGASHNKQSNKIVGVPPLELRSEEWFATHEWRILRQPVEQLKKSSGNNLVFLCGSAGNEYDVWDVFDLVICLDIDEKTLRHRVTTRTDNEYGKKEHELATMLDWHKTYTQDHKKAGAKIVDATQPIHRVIEDILSLCKPLQNKKR